MRKQLKSEKGFSLMELIVVVAIIAILANIAVPGYQTFRLKARQKEGIALLNSYFMAAQAFKVEHGGYKGNFSAIGFAPTGEIKYRLTAANNTAITIFSGPDDASCVATDAGATDCPSIEVTWREKVGGGGTSNSGNHAIGAYQMAIGTAEVKNHSFKVFASGVVSVNAVHPTDQWGINAEKLLVNVCDGLVKTGTVTCSLGSL